MSHYLNFQDLKSRVSLEAVVLEYYNVKTLKRRGNNLVGPCFVHGGDNPTAFHADLTKNLWHCFTRCGRGGDQLTLVAERENISIREAAVRLSDYFLGGQTPRPPPRPRPPLSQLPEPRLNRPLTFRLTLHLPHPHLDRRGLSQATCRQFGVGYASRGIMAGCIAIPIHNDLGQLVAYAGRRIKPGDIERCGKYTFPRGFYKDQVLYHWHQAKPYASEHGIVVVEGFFSVMALHQLGYPNVVAVMGCHLSRHQAKLLITMKPTSVTILFDGNDAGKQGAERTRALLASAQPDLPVQVVELADDREPEDLTPDELIALFGPPQS